MSWLFSNVAGGVVRWATATIIAAVCIVLGFSPPQWFAAIITEPPPWLISPGARVMIILAGTIACFLLAVWHRLFSKAKEIPVAYFDCKIGYWPEAEQAHNCVSFVIMQFDLEHPTLGISHGGPIAKENHNKPFSSIAPLKCEITFFNKDPMFNVQIPLTIDIFETIRARGRNTRGRCVNNIDTALNLNQVYTTDKKTFTFYVYSFDFDAYIGIRNHNIFKFSNSADETRFEGKLINSNSLITSIGPAP